MIEGKSEIESRRVKVGSVKVHQSFIRGYNTLTILSNEALSDVENHDIFEIDLVREEEPRF